MQKVAAGSRRAGDRRPHRRRRSLIRRSARQARWRASPATSSPATPITRSCAATTGRRSSSTTTIGAATSRCCRRPCVAHGVAVHGYVLMTQPRPPGRHAGPSRSRWRWSMQAVGRQYVRYFNRRHGRTGTLWEGRYRASIIEEDRYLLACLRYVEMNPVRAGHRATRRKLSLVEPSPSPGPGRRTRW